MSDPFFDPFFIVGFPRSGTTLLSVLLDRHSRLAVPPETGFFDEIAPRLSPDNVSRLRKVLERWRRLPELHLTSDDVIARLPPSWNEGDVLRAMLELYANANGKARCGEKTPQHLNHVPAILRHFPRAKILCMLRDGRDAVLSLRSMPWFRGRLSTAAEMWRKNLRLAETHSLVHPQQFAIVRYEDLIARPDAELTSVMQFLGESFEPHQLETSVASNVVLPRSMEWKGRALGAIDAGQAGRRRADARPKDVAYLERVLREDLLRHGYD